MKQTFEINHDRNNIMPEDIRKALTHWYGISEFSVKSIPAQTEPTSLPITDIFQAHPTAIIDECTIGAGTKIWQWTHISDGARIGQNCTIGQNVFIGKNVKIGDGCKIQNGANIFEGVLLENDVFIGPGVTFTNIKYPEAGIDQSASFRLTLVKSAASIGANATILPGVVIGHGAMIGAGSVVTHTVIDACIVYGNPARTREL
jgi:UDP-2-acetamido-3-amino-2,3-dideoxy-glucuronate N-acetyltransferase